jgi:hypothetical protein
VICLLVGQPAAAEDGYRVATVRVLNAADLRDDPVEGRVPGSGFQWPATLRADERCGEPVRGRQQFGRGPSLPAQPARAFGGVARLDFDAAVDARPQRHGALQGTVWAVSRHTRRRRTGGHGFRTLGPGRREHRSRPRCRRCRRRRW